MRLHVIVNPAAGRSKPALESLFRPYAAGLTITPTAHPGHAESLARAAAESGAEVVVVCGGDGTVSEAARGLVGTGIPLAILPGGTANLLAHDLNIPHRLTDAAALIFSPRVTIRPVDMGEIGDHLRFFHLGIGLEGEMVRRSGRAAKSAAGLLAYYLSALATFPTYRPARYRLTLDDQITEIDGINCTITTYGHIGPLSLSHAIDPGEGLLDVIVIRRADLKRLLLAGTSALLSRDLSRAVWHRQARRVSLEVQPPQAITADGELISLEYPLNIHVLPNAARFFVPES